MPHPSSTVELALVWVSWPEDLNVGERTTPVCFGKAGLRIMSAELAWATLDLALMAKAQGSHP